MGITIIVIQILIMIVIIVIIIIVIIIINITTIIIISIIVIIISTLAHSHRRTADPKACSSHRCNSYFGERVLEPIAALGLPRGHRIWRSGPMLWCTRCAYYAERRVYAMRDTCKGFVMACNRTRRDRLRDGCRPATGLNLGAANPFSLQESPPAVAGALEAQPTGGGDDPTRWGKFVLEVAVACIGLVVRVGGRAACAMGARDGDS